MCALDFTLVFATHSLCHLYCSPVYSTAEAGFTRLFTKIITVGVYLEMRSSNNVSIFLLSECKFKWSAFVILELIHSDMKDKEDTGLEDTILLTRL